MFSLSPPCLAGVRQCCHGPCAFVFLMIRPPPRSTQAFTLFPYTTLFRSDQGNTIRDLFNNAEVPWPTVRSEEHTSELQSRTLISYAVFCLKKKKHLEIPLMIAYLVYENQIANKQDFY